MTVDQLLLKYAKKGLFTEARVSCGHLSTPAPNKIWSYSRSSGREDVFDLASLTKALVTAPFFLQRPELLTQQVSDFTPKEFPPGIGVLKIKDLLSHSSGLPPWLNFWINVFDATGSKIEAPTIPSVICRSLNHFKSHHAKDVYSDVGFLILGYIAEIITERKLDRIFEDEKKRLNLSHLDLSYSSDADRAIPTSYCALRCRTLKGEVHDENAGALGGACAHAGLFGTIEAIHQYLHAIAQMDYFESWINDQIRNVSLGRSVTGWRPAQEGETYSSTAVGHYGFTGTSFWVNPEGYYSVILTNRVISGRINPLISSLRSETHKIIEKNSFFRK